MKFKKHPVTGEPLALKDVVKLNFHKNSDGEYMCPVLNKVFTEHTHIVAIRTTGNVYCWEVGALTLIPIRVLVSVQARMLRSMVPAYWHLALYFLSRLWRSSTSSQSTGKTSLTTRLSQGRTSFICRTHSICRCCSPLNVYKLHVEACNDRSGTFVCHLQTMADISCT